MLKDGRPPISYDVLSIDIGSNPRMGSVGQTGDATAITPVKPIDGFSARWDAIVEKVGKIDGKVKLVVVGGGAGGIELALSMQIRLRNELKNNDKDPDNIKVSVVTRGAKVLSSHSKEASKKFASILQDRKIEVLYEHEVVQEQNGTLVCTNGNVVPFDECIWCTQAGTQQWLKNTTLSLDDGGFIRVDESLQSINTPGVFAAGDCAALYDPRPKAGVFAVFAGPPLAVCKY